jgi:hypothetical protein
VSSGFAAGQSFEFPKAPEPEPTWLQSFWELPVFKWLAGLEVSPIAPPEVTIAAPAPPPCSVAPLAAIEDPTAMGMESASTLNLEGLTPGASRALAKFEKIVQARGGSFTVTSAYRPSTYQAHLRDVWFKWTYELRDNQERSCLELKADVGNEFVRHGLLATQHPVEISDHSMGIGFDAVVVFPTVKRKRSRVSVDRLSRLAGVSRPAIRRDPVHFRVIGGRG